ncbi:MAG: CBS domain-containing protein [Acidobacteriota bacterium]|jgi:CBS domain-containing protein
MTETRILVARDLMTAESLTLHPDMEMIEAIRLMAARHVSGALVLDGRRLVGLLTEKDCLRVLTLSAYHEEESGTVREFMSPLPECLAPDMDLFRISKLFLETNFPVLPVLEGDHVVGQVTRQRMLRAIQETAKEFEAEERRREKVEEDSEKNTSRPRSIEDMQRTFASSTRDQLIRRLKRKG